MLWAYSARNPLSAIFAKFGISPLAIRSYTISALPASHDIRKTERLAGTVGSWVGVGGFNVGVVVGVVVATVGFVGVAGIVFVFAVG